MILFQYKHRRVVMRHLSHHLYLTLFRLLYLTLFRLLYSTLCGLFVGWFSLGPPSSEHRRSLPDDEINNYQVLCVCVCELNKLKQTDNRTIRQLNSDTHSVESTVSTANKSSHSGQVASLPFEKGHSLALYLTLAHSG